MLRPKVEEKTRIPTHTMDPLFVNRLSPTSQYYERPSIKHQFDTGAACKNFALEASIRDIVTNGVKDLDYEKITSDLEILGMYYMMLLGQ